MLDNEDLKWIATTSTELNSMLQQISRYSDLARQHKGEHNYVELLGERVDLASKTAQSLFDRVTSKILARTSAGSSPTPLAGRVPAFTIVPSPTAPSPTPSKKGKLVVSPQEKPGVAKLEAVEKDPTVIPPEIKVVNPNGTRELILLVDDEADVAEGAAELLAAEGYRVIVAHDGFEALKIYQQIGRFIALIILDFFLPIIDGDAVFDELRALNPNVNVVLSSGFAEQSKISNMLALGLRGFIPKPYTREKMLEQIRSALDASRHQIR